MSTFYYTLIVQATREPYSERRAEGDFTTLAQVDAWIQANDPDFVLNQTDVLHRRIDNREADDRGLFSTRISGDLTDAAATPGSTGTFSSKLRLVTSQLDAIQTNSTTIANNEIPLTVFFQGNKTGTANNPVEIFAGVSRYTGRKGYFLTNNNAFSLFIGPLAVTVSGPNAGKELKAGNVIFEPFGNVARYVVGGSNFTFFVEEVS